MILVQLLPTKLTSYYMMSDRDLAKIIATLEAAKAVCLVCHRKPDGDALGALLGLANVLTARGMVVSRVCIDPVPSRYQWLPDATLLHTALPQPLPEVVVQLDCGSDRLSGLPLTELAEVLIDIDHHPKSGPPASPRLTWYDPAASSTAEMMLRLCQAASWPLSRDAATCLLTGVITDTSAFQNGNTTADTLTAAATLLSHGGRHKEVVRKSFYTSSIPKLRLWGTAMARIDQQPAGQGVVSTVLTIDDIRECGAAPEDAEGLVNFLNAMPGVPALLLLLDLGEGVIKGSLRTRRSQIDVAKLARQLGGGGHRQAAAFSVPGQLRLQPDDSWTIDAVS